MDKLFILKNIDEAIRLVTEQPPELFALAQYRLKRDCGTLYCTAGLLCTSAHFRKLGWKWAAGRDLPVVCDYIVDVSPGLDKQFGDDAFEKLFSPRGASGYDTGLTFRQGVTDKQLALHRLRSHRQYVEAL